MKANTLQVGLGAAAGLYVKETVLILAATVVLPLVVHLLPAQGGVPWGARLLPLFLAPFAGVALFRLHVGLLPALLAPALSVLVTGLPALSMVAALTVDLVVFTLLSYALVRRAPGFVAAAPLAYVLTRLLTAPLALFIPAFGAPGTLTGALWTAVPGLVLLFGINLVVVAARRRAGA